MHTDLSEDDSKFKHRESKDHKNHLNFYPHLTFFLQWWLLESLECAEVDWLYVKRMAMLRVTAQLRQTLRYCGTRHFTFYKNVHF